MALVATAALAQVTPGGTPSGSVGRPPPVESAPLPPPSGSPAPQGMPSAPSAQGTPPAQAAPATPPASGATAPTRYSSAGRPTLVPQAGDPTDVDQVTLPGKPSAVLAGTSTWDDGFKTLQNAFRTIEDALVQAGIAPAGKPLTVFVETDDLGFRYEAMIPIPEAPAGRPSLTPEVRFGRTPEGAAMRFVHKGAYEDIDETYETITAYLDAKGIAVRDSFIEEYVADLTERTDPNLEINIFVQPK
jgi:effector-binding domain-containing protein